MPVTKSQGVRRRLQAIPAIGPLLYRVSEVPSPFYHGNSPASRALQRHVSDYLATRSNPLTLNIGSQSPRRAGTINLDIAQCGHASVLGDATSMPFADESFDAIVNIAVMEHVRYPGTIAKECLRVLKPEGRIYCAIPFFQMFHPDPIDMQRYTVDGIVNLFGDFIEIEKGVEVGPASATALTLREFLAILFSFRSKLAYDALQLLFGYATWPIKFMDHFLVHHPAAYMIASSVYFVGEKPHPAPSGRVD